MRPVFSIVIPTLNRSDTLEYSLKTIIPQVFDSYELLVSDNCSNDKTEEVVTKAQRRCKKIRYIKTSQTMSMSRHWEFALDHVQGKYVAFVGDDDGITPNALSKSYDILKKYNEPDALASLNCEYHWPSSPLAGHSNIAKYPVTYHDYEIESREALTKCCNFEYNYRNLPLIYNGWIKKDIINKIKNKTGTFFKSCTPDVYSGVAVASQINSYIFSESPLFIYGVSGHSNGANSSQNKKTDKSFFTEDSIPFHKKVPYCVSIPFLVAESIYQCIDAKLIDEKLSPDPQILSEKAIVGALTLGKERYFEAVDAIKKYANSFGLDVSYLIERNPYKEISKSPFPDQIVWQDKILEKNALGMRMDSVGVKNIYQFTKCLPVADANQGSVIILFQELLGMYQEISELKNKELKNINELNLLNQTLSWMESSVSWKITQPLRDALSVVRSR